MRKEATMDKLSCRGCGITLQTADETAVGYILEKHLKNQKCQRCFRIQQYSDFQVVDIQNEALYTLIDNIAMDDSLMIHMLDITDLLGSSLFELASSLRKKPIIVIVNKIDVIPKAMRRYDIWYQYIQESFKMHEIEVLDIFFVSAKENLGIRFFLTYLEEFASDKAVKIIGSANVGKSSLIQAFFREQNLSTSVAPIISPIPGTTLNELEITCEKITLYDTPGVMKPQQFTYHLPPKFLKEITLLKPIRAINYPIYEPQCFFVGGYVQVKITPAGNNSITFYFNQQLPIHRRKVEASDQFFAEHIGSLLSPPTADLLEISPQLRKHVLTKIVTKRDKTDIVISGLGWISIKSRDAVVEIWTLPKVLVYKKNALV
ncbi:MAG: ribosome biogenesis GTPase YqeH [Culicoidibacterales bacterium]